MRFILTVIILTALLCQQICADEDLFSDILPTDPYAQTIQPLKDAGIFFGYPDNTFRGNEYVTRYELAVVVNRMMEYFEESLVDLHASTTHTHKPQSAPETNPDASIITSLLSKHIPLSGEMLYHEKELASADDVTELIASAMTSLIERTSPELDNKIAHELENRGQSTRSDSASNQKPD